MHARPPAGLLFALTSRIDVDLPRAATVAGGIPILIRQIRQFRALGIDHITVLASHEANSLKAVAQTEARRRKIQLDWTDAAEAIGVLGRDRDLLVLDEALLIDERLLEAFHDAAGSHDPRAGALLAQWSGRRGTSGGVAYVAAGMLDPARLCDAPAGPPRDTRMLAAAALGIVSRFDFSAIDTYAPARRRRVPMVWGRLDSRRDGHAATATLLASAQKGCLDWPARFIHPPIENLLTRLLLPTPITPNILSLGIFILGLYVAWLFAAGQAWPALLLALVIGPLDGVDGKLARTRHEFSRWGDLEHIGDKIVEYLWFAGIAAWIGTAWAWAIAAVIVFFALAEALQGEIFHRLTGRQLDDAGELERAFRLVSGRRNTFMWTLVPFGLAQAWHAGFIMIAIYAVITFFFTQLRSFVRLSTQFREDPQAAERNAARTSYAFMPAKTQPAE